ncbi:MAG TPA: 50S ribosomal protein L2, partial [Candidatus Paceibacterota bacterium]|nr:50S ribosomal protein L2 [Candidatus Paceibacterota bacterium]
LPLRLIPAGTFVHNVELVPGGGGKLVRAAGGQAQLLAKDGEEAILKFPSSEQRIININCRATIGQVGNINHKNRRLGKAGRMRHLGRRPKVRGVAKNPVDHPHGGGEGRSGIGRVGPLTPWGKPALGHKTRRRRNRWDAFILQRRAK